MRGIPRNRYDGGGDSKNASALGASALMETLRGSEMVSRNGSSISPSDQPTPKLTHKKKIGAGSSDGIDVAANAISKNAATTTSAPKEDGLLYHKSMLAYPLITTTSRVKSTGSGRSSSTDKEEEEQATLVSNLTDPTALKRSDLHLDGDTANFIGASAAKQKEAANQAEKVKTDDVAVCHVADDEDEDDGNDEVGDHGTTNLGRPVMSEVGDANSHATPGKLQKQKISNDNATLSSRPPPHPTTPASPATEASETYCYLTVPHSSDATKVSSLGDMDSPCRQALIREFTARFGHGPNSQIIDDGFIKGAAGQSRGHGDLVDFVESADGCQDGNRMMMDSMDPALVALDPIEAERTMYGVDDKKTKKNTNSRAMLSYRPSASSSHQRRQEEPGSATSATMSNSRDPVSSSYDTGSDHHHHQSDTSGWVSPSDSPGKTSSPRSGVEGSSDLDFDDYKGQGGGCMTSSDDAGSDPEDEISRSRLQADKEETMMLESILNDSSPALPHIQPLAPPSPQSLDADDEISRCRDELNHQTATSLNDSPFANQYIHRPRRFSRSGRTIATSRREAFVGLLDSTELESQAYKYNKLGADLISRGKMSEAQSIFRKAIQAGRQDLSSVQRRIALLRENQSIDFSSAEEASMNHRIRVLAAHVADSLNNLGVLYDLMNDYDAAVASCENALDLYLSTAGRRNDGTDRDVERSLANIDQMENARSTWPQRKRLHQQDDDAARNIQRCNDSSERKRLQKMRLRILGSVIELERNSLGKNHPQVARTLLARGLVRIQLGHASASISGHGNYADGLAEIRNAVHIFRSALGDRHPDTARAVAKLAQIYQRRNSSERSVSESGQNIIRYDPDRALGLYQLGIKILRASKGNGDGGVNEYTAEISFLLDCVGTIHQNKRNFPKAIEAYSAASAALGGRNRQVQIRQRGRTSSTGTSGRSVMTDDGDTHHPLMARIWLNLGLCLFRKKDAENALDAFDFCLLVLAQNRRKREITGMVIGSGDGFAPSIFGGTLDEFNYFHKERSSSDADLDIVPVFSELDDSILMAQALLSTGKAQSELGWHGKAGTSYEEAGRVSKRCLKMLKSCKDSGDENTRRSLDVARIFEGLGDMWSLKGSVAAMEYYDKCTGLHRTIGGDDYLAFARLLGKKSALHMKNGHYRDAVDILSDVVALFKTKGMPPNHPDLLNVTTMLRDARNAAERSGMNLSERPGGANSTSRSDRHGRSGKKSTSARREIPLPADSASAASSASIDLAFAFDKKAEAMRKAHRYDEAMEACQGALKIRHAQVEEATTDFQKRNVRIDIGRTMRNLAFLLNKMAEYSKARSLYREALDLYRMCDLPPSHPYCLTVQKELDALSSRVYGY